MKQTQAKSSDHETGSKWRQDNGFSDRLRQVIKMIGMENAVTASGRNERSLARYVAGAEPPLSVVTHLASAAGVPVDWLATGASPSDSLPSTLHVQPGTQQEHLSEAMLQIVDQQALENGAFVVLPRMDVSAAAGSGRLPPDFPEVKSYVALSEDYLRSIGVPARYAKLLEIDGDSMVPTLKDRDVAVVDTSITDVRGNAVYAVVWGGLVLAKRVHINRDGSITLSSDNKAAGYPDERISAGDLHELHVAGRIRGRVGGL